MIDPHAQRGLIVEMSVRIRYFESVTLNNTTAFNKHNLGVLYIIGYALKFVSIGQCHDCCIVLVDICMTLGSASDLSDLHT